MEVYFLLLLILLMVGALSSGFPVAFALPGSAILSIAVAALCGWLFAGDGDAFFSHGGPNEWLSAGVTNFRSLYWVNSNPVSPPLHSRHNRPTCG